MTPMITTENKTETMDSEMTNSSNNKRSRYYEPPFKVEQKDYIQLTPLGLFPHPRGLQKVDETAIQALAKNFNSFMARLGRRFTGIPLYIGHPDVPGYENTYTDRKAYGWIMKLQPRSDGLYGLLKWSDAGADLIANGHF